MGYSYFKSPRKLFIGCKQHRKGLILPFHYLVSCLLIHFFALLHNVNISLDGKL